MLGIEKTASAADIQKAFQRQCKSRHPDKGGDGDGFHALLQARSVLLDLALRKAYDTGGVESVEALQKGKQEVACRAQSFLALLEVGADSATPKVWLSCFTDIVNSISNGAEDVQAWLVRTEVLERLGSLHRHLKLSPWALEDRAEVQVAFTACVCTALRGRRSGQPQVLQELEQQLARLASRRHRGGGGGTSETEVATLLERVQTLVGSLLLQECMGEVFRGRPPEPASPPPEAVGAA